MNILTDEELDAITDAQWGKQDVGAMYAAHRAFGTAIQAAVIAKMTAGVSVEPWTTTKYVSSTIQYELFTRDQLTTAIAAARVAALEEAAKICDTTPVQPFRPSIEAAWAIRALIGKEST